MPPRSSSTSRRRVAVPAPQAPHAHEIAYLRRRSGQHAAMITILWVVLVAFFLGGTLLLLQHALRLQELEQGASITQERVMQQLDGRLQTAMQNLAALQAQVGTATPTSPPSIPSTLPTSEPSKSPTSELTRGSVSPDGTKYAGYEDTKKGKIGIAVEILNAGEPHKVKYIVIFSASQSSGANLPQGSMMSVRWKDNSTIEYDLLTKKGSSWVQSVGTVKIFF